ncbi:MAG TPA: flavin reductase family protein [Streptosporangiaceae bacterium]|nr:flavin reductase family protein [Streptosporangiaceae bacterium]
MSGRFREMMSRFPTGVAVVTCLDLQGAPQGMTCTSLASVCLDPPTLLVSLRTASATSAAVAAGTGFAVNLLGGGAHDVAKLFSSPVRDKFADVCWRPSPHGHPWLDEDAVAKADCSISQRATAGDHAIYFGEVVDLTLSAVASPLLYGMRAYGNWAASAPLPYTRQLGQGGRRE